MLIDTQLAQLIIDNITPIVKQNINIMDNSGMIIGSCQKKRIHTMHQGAKEVLANGASVEIYPDQMERYPGTMPGSNWPIILGKQIVGVVGVSGHPEQVRDTAKLVKMVTELILERELLIEEVRSHSQLLQQFLQLLLAENIKNDDPRLVRIADILRFDLQLPRVVIVVNTLPLIEEALSHYGPYDLVSSRTKESLASVIQESGLMNPEDIFISGEKELVILKYFPIELQARQFEKWGADFIRIVNQDGSVMRLGIGSLVTNVSELSHSYKEAAFSLNHSQNHISSIYQFDIMASYLMKVPEGIPFCKAFRELKEKLTHKVDVKYDMRKTIQALLENNLNVSTTAKALFIHRNSLVFRLDRLKDLTGLCPSQHFNHAILCKLLVNV